MTFIIIHRVFNMLYHFLYGNKFVTLKQSPNESCHILRLNHNMNLIVFIYRSFLL